MPLSVSLVVRIDLSTAVSLFLDLFVAQHMPPPTAAASAGFLTERLEALLYMEAVTQQFFSLLLECFNGSEILFCILQLQQQQLWYCESLRGFCFAAFAAAANSSESVIFLRHLFRSFFLFRLKVFLVSIVCKVVVGGDGGSESCYLNFDLVSRHPLLKSFHFPFSAVVLVTVCLPEWIFSLL